MKTIDAHCGWNTGQGNPDDLEGLHAILLCAARQGCRGCVECSEKALEMVLKATRKEDKMPPGSAAGK